MVICRSLKAKIPGSIPGQATISLDKREKIADNSYMRIYGPYKRKDGRKHVILVEGKKKTTLSYPRLVMAKHLGRDLLPTETVDHIDNDFTNDTIENLQLLSLIDNVKKNHKLIEWFTFNCPVCHKEVKKTASRVRGNRKQGKAGSFCDKKCARKFQASVANGTAS